MAKRVDPAKAKAAKQKKIAIGGMVVLVALLAVQGPKTLKMLKGPQPVAAPASTTPGGPAPTPGGPAPTTGGPAPTTGGPAPVPATGGTTGGTAAGEAPAAAPELASVPDSDQAPVVDTGQLATFERFSSKDPFAQQAEPVAAPAAPKPKPDAAADPAKTPVTNPDGSGSTVDGGFTTGGGTASPAKTAQATSIAVNGVAETVTVKVPFPAEEPTFVLVSVAADGKSVQIGVDGGEYADGGETLKLVLGKKITLQNTADGRRYELQLLSVQGFPLPKQTG